MYGGDRGKRLTVMGRGCWGGGGGESLGFNGGNGVEALQSRCG